MEARLAQTTKKTGAAKTAAKKTPAKKPAAKTTKKTATKKTAAKPSVAEKGVKTMANAAEKAQETMKKNAEAATERAKEIFGDVNERAKAAFEKGSEMFREVGEFNKGNVEAMVESGKLYAKGMQDLGKQNVEYVRENFEATTAAVKEMASVKSPTDFFKLQGEHARKGFDTAVSQASKNTEAWMKLAGEAFQPISERVSVAGERFSKAA